MESTLPSQLTPEGAATYDALPYEGHPDPMIHLDRMAAVAWLHGVNAASLENARVLDIGCATGAHIIPMACQFPHASFVGFDYSAKQIELAQESARAAGITNLQFFVRDILEPHDDLGQFDYIIAHGVFSWVPPSVQGALLEICRQHLAPAGVALIDYNTLPGWHLRNFLRDLVAYHQRAIADPQAAVSAALASMDQISAHLLVPASPFAQMIANLQRWTKAQPANYLIHELGSTTGRPIPFTEFATGAQQHRLNILGDAEITHVLPRQLADSLKAQFSETAETDYVRREQYLDFLRGREFRRTLLVREDVVVQRSLVTTALKRLRFSTVARHESWPGGAAFRTPDGAVLQTVNIPLSQAIIALCRAGPVGLAFEELWCSTGAAKGAEAEYGRIDFAKGLLEACAAGIVQLHAHRTSAVGIVTQKPVANALARAAAQAGNHSVTSMLQRDWRIDAFERQLLCLLDGTQDRGTLVTLLAAAAKQAEWRAKGVSGMRISPSEINARVDSSLEWFSRVGILIG